MEDVVITVIMDTGMAGVSKGRPYLYRELVIPMNANPLVDGLG